MRGVSPVDGQPLSYSRHTLGSEKQAAFFPDGGELLHAKAFGPNSRFYGHSRGGNHNPEPGGIHGVKHAAEEATKSLLRAKFVGATFGSCRRGSGT